MYKALADANRRKILEILQMHDMNVQEISRYFNFSGATLSHHLDTLKKANLVIAERKGQFIEYSLNTSVFEEIVKKLINTFQKKEKI